MMSRRLPASGLPLLAVLPALLLAAYSHAQTAPDSAPGTARQARGARDDSPLPQVVVTGTRYEEEVQVVPAHVITIGREQIASSNVATVNEAVMRFGGVPSRASLAGGRELTADPMGFGDTAGSNLVVLVDGVPMREGDATEVRLSGIPIESVERIEIQKGSAAVLYGSGSTAGVINIITRASARSAAGTPSASVYIGAGSFGTREARANLRHADEGLDLSLSASHRRSDGYREHSNSDSRDVFLSATFQAGATRLGSSLRSEQTEARTAGPVSVATFLASRRAAQADSVTHDTRSDIASHRLSAFAETELAGVLWRADASVRKRELDAVAVFWGSPARLLFDGTDSQLGFSGLRSDTLSVGANRLLFGVERTQWSQERVYPGSPFGDFRLKFGGTGYFIKNDLDLASAATRITAGYRHETSDRSQLSYKTADRIAADFSHSAWEIGASHALSATDTVYARESTSFRFANIDEFTTSYDANYNIAALRPQTSRDHEIGWKRRFGDRGRLDARLYQSDLDNEIILDPNFNNINLDPTRRRGIDLDAGFQATRSLFVGGSLALRDARFAEGVYRGRQVPLSAREVVTLRAEYAMAAGRKIGMITQWVAGQHVALDFDNQVRMPSYGVTDIYYQHRIGQVDLSLRVLNLFDKAYYSYATLSNGAAAVYPDAGRSVWLSARLGF